MQMSKFIDGAVVKNSDLTLVKHVLSEQQMLKTRHKTTLLAGRLLNTRRKIDISAVKLLNAS